MAGSDAAAHPSVVYSDEFDTSVAMFNIVFLTSPLLLVYRSEILSPYSYLSMYIIDCRQLFGIIFMNMQNHSHIWIHCTRTLNLYPR